MKFAIFALLSLLVAFAIASLEIDDNHQCGDGAHWHVEGWARKFTCTTDGVVVDNNVPGCACESFDDYYNTETKTCMRVQCDNMDCVGKENEKFFSSCQSGSRDRCWCSNMMTMDCRIGCMCKNGYCRKEGKCVKRDCVHPIFNDDNDNEE